MKIWKCPNCGREYDSDNLPNECECGVRPATDVLTKYGITPDHDGWLLELIAACTQEEWNSLGRR